MDKIPTWIIPLILAAIAGLISYSATNQHVVDLEKEIRKDILRIEKQVDKNDNVTRRLEIVITRIDTNLIQINKKLEKIDISSYTKKKQK